ncbi:hypothetical protein M0R45_020767 [Rubus argutus]|uniref:Pyruvate phosphate dikinase AMP/ATP-binding domain-containing protein n=1 Tax=Rubus argutus TaxID=59490 RepID=A0AAW1XAL9_RUBAR
MSSTVKGILLRTPPEVSYIHRMFKDRSLNGGVNGGSGRAGQTRYQPQAATITNGITNPSPKKNELQSPGQIGAQAISSPVLDPSTPTTHKRVFTFGKGRSEGNKGMKSLLGGKGANLAEMASIGLSVPPGLTISTEACQEYQENGKELPEGLWEEILEGLDYVQNAMGATLGDPSKPLLVSVRSGAAISMPGMMDTVLNLGLNDEVVAGLAAKSGDPLCV